MKNKNFIQILLLISISFVFIIQLVSSQGVCDNYKIIIGSWEAYDFKQVEGAYPSIDCYKSLIDKGITESICEQVPSENEGKVLTPQYMQELKEKCYFGFAVAKLDSSLCNKASYPSNCFYVLAVNSNSLFDWINAIGNIRFFVSLFLILGALISCLIIVFMNRRIGKVIFISTLFISLLILALSFSFFMGRDTFQASFIDFFKTGFGAGLLFYNLLLIPFFVIGWQSIMKKLSSHHKIYSFFYALFGGIILSGLTHALATTTFYTGMLGLEIIGLVFTTIIFSIINAIVFSILFIIYSKNYSN